MQALGENVGFVNPAIYAIGSTAFRSIPGSPGPANNGFDGVAGYPAGPGWDACTGWGSINGTALLEALPGIGLPPALAVFNGALAMAWKGVKLDDRIFWSTFNGTTWAAQQVVAGVGTSSGVALAVFEGKLYMAWKGLIDLSGTTLFDDERIWWSAYNGASWSAQQSIPEVATSTGPRLAVYNNLLYAAWKGEFDDPSIWWSSFNGTTWTPQKQIPGVATSVGPALAVFNNALYAAWKGEFGDQSIWWSSFNGTTWAAQKQVPGVASTEGPSLAVFQNALYAAWKGASGDQSIWWSSFNGTTWAPRSKSRRSPPAWDHPWQSSTTHSTPRGRVPSATSASGGRASTARPGPLSKSSRGSAQVPTSRPVMSFSRSADSAVPAEERPRAVVAREAAKTLHAPRASDRPAAAQGTVNCDQVERDVGPGDGQLILLRNERRLVRIHPVEVDRASFVLSDDKIHRSFRGGYSLLEPFGLLLSLQEGNECIFSFLTGLQNGSLICQNIGREPRLLGSDVVANATVIENVPLKRGGDHSQEAVGIKYF